MSVPERALLRRFPDAPLPHVPLGAFPTPVEELDLSGVVPGFSGRAWVKREDLCGAELGGNKVRKLELVLADARRRGARTVLTLGGIGSNHCLATAWYASEAGCEVELVMFPHAVTPTSRRTLRAICALGPRITWVGSDALVAPAAAVRLGVLGASRQRPYLILPGGSSVTGTLGFVGAGLELAEQVAAGELEQPDVVCCAYSSGGTAAGLAVGLQLAGCRATVLAARVYPRPLASDPMLHWLATRTHRRLQGMSGRRLEPFDRARLRSTGAQLGAGYAEPTPEAAAAREIGEELGLQLEPTYTAKAFAAFLDLAATRRYRDGQLLFVQTYDPRIPDVLAEGPESAPEALRPYL